MASTLPKKIRKMRIASKKHQDFDPEDDSFIRGPPSSGSEDESQDEVADASREHYELVTASKLRRPEKVELDAKKYSGQPVSKAMLYNEENEDPLAPQEDSDEDPFGTQKAGPDVGEDDSDSSVIDAAELNEGWDGTDDEEIDSDDAFQSGDEEAFRQKGFKFRGSSTLNKPTELVDAESDDNNSGDEEQQTDDSMPHADQLERSSEEDSDASMDDDQDRSDDVDEDQDSGSEGEDGSSDDDLTKHSTKKPSRSAPLQPSADREMLKKMISLDTATISASLSQAASADAKKGNAVKQQYHTFDRFLDTRIKLQKGLTAASDLNSSSAIAEAEEDGLQSAARKAEQAAMQLFSTIEALRSDILDAQASISDPQSKKRKRNPAATDSTSISELHDRLDDLELQSVPYRRAVLDKWANKTRAANPTTSSRLKLEAEQTQTKLTSVLDAYLLSSGPKLVQDSLTSSTKSSPSSNKREDDGTTNGTSRLLLSPYQDILFYQSLLRDLIVTKSYVNPSSTSTSSAAMTYSINDRAALPAKIHRQVDRKASKGRKIRYTVHEKLENFMASTGRQSVGEQWTEPAIREFFGSLMGMKNQLAEYSDEEAGGDGDLENRDDDYLLDSELQNGDVGALKLFKS